MDNRLVCYSAICIFSGCISLILISDFTYKKFNKITLMSKARMLALIAEHIFFFGMVYWLNKIEASMANLVKWVLILSGGITLASTMAHFIGWMKSPHLVREMLFFEIDLDPKDRIVLNLYNHLFVEIWVYASIVFFILMVIVIAVKVKDQQQRKKRERAIKELVVKEEFREATYPNQRSCCVCLMDYQENEQIMRIPCGHIFHEECLLGWMKENSTCPLCRISILEGLNQSVSQA